MEKKHVVVLKSSFVGAKSLAWSVASLSVGGKRSNAYPLGFSLGLAVPQEYAGMLVEQKGFIHSVSPNLGC